MKFDNIIKSVFYSRIGFLKVLTSIIIIFLFSNINAVVDHYIHPEIPFFDKEHLIVGTITGIFSLCLGAIILFYINWLQKINVERGELLAELNKAKEKYTGLYDFAPAGYLTLSKELDIKELNYSAATILGKDRALLKNMKFDSFISRESRPSFDLFFRKIFISKTKEICEIRIETGGNDYLYTYIEGVSLGDGEQCLVTFVDITDRKKTESELKKKSDELKQFNSYFIDRECKMIELKKEINELLIKSGGEKKYSV